ncbi:MAG: hypothetical protein WC476_01300 [Phycisphaerae bacterium]
MTKFNNDAIVSEYGNNILIRFPCGKEIIVFIPFDKELELEPVDDDFIVQLSLPFDHCEHCTFVNSEVCFAKYIDNQGIYYCYELEGKRIYRDSPATEEELRELFNLEGEEESKIDLL